MIEKIYTIPINEAFDVMEDCPFCSLYSKLENNELELILGASMMEPDVRIKTNALGFCGKHYSDMFARKNRLGLALMIESHLSEKIMPDLKKNKIKSKDRSCYVCERIGFHLSKMFSNTVLLWEKEREFKEKLAKQKYFCLNHYSMLTDCGERMLSRKINADFYAACKKIMTDYSESLFGDVSWFVKKFDYRYENEDWGNSKDAVERAIKFL